MELSRREVLRLLAMTAGGAAAMHATQGLAYALTASPNPPTLVWLTDGADDLNLLTLLGQETPQFHELTLLQWNVRQHPGLMPTAYAGAQGEPPAPPIAIVEALPRLDDDAEGDEARAALSGLFERAKAAVLLGTDACFGGIRASGEDVARFEDFCRYRKTPVIKLPGIPVPPHHLVGVLAHLEYFGFPELDAQRRPLLYYRETVCLSCERRADLDAGRFANRFGEPGCLFTLGCKGIITHNSCSRTRWNNGENWCVGAGGPCTGCAEPGFPDHGGLGLYGRLPDDERGSRSLIWEHMQAFGYGVLGLAGAGTLLELGRRLLLPTTEEEGQEPGREDGRR